VPFQICSLTGESKKLKGKGGRREEYGLVVAWSQIPVRKGRRRNGHCSGRGIFEGARDKRSYR